MGWLESSFEREAPWGVCAWLVAAPTTLLPGEMMQRIPLCFSEDKLSKLKWK